MHRFTVNPTQPRLCVRETSKQITGLHQDASDHISGRLARVRPRRAAVCNTLTRFGRLPACILPFINPERCLPQEFSDEEDIDALISAHNKTANQHLNSCLSTVPPESQTHPGKSCMPSAQTCTCIHTPSPYP